MSKSEPPSRTSVPCSLELSAGSWKSIGWMDGWMDGWIDGWMDGWMDRWMDGWIKG